MNNSQTQIISDTANHLTLLETNEDNSYIMNVATTIKKEKNLMRKSLKTTLLNLEKLEENRFLISRIGLAPKNVTLLCGTGSSGKTLLAQMIGLCVTSGVSFFGYTTVETGEVLHIDNEQDEELTTRRYSRIANSLNIKSVNITQITTERFDDVPTAENQLEQLANGKKLIIIDSLKSSTSADENSSEIEKSIKMLKRVAISCNCAVLLIHHKGKGKDAKQSGRGHSSIYDSVDCQIDLDSCRDSNGEKIYNLTCAKIRDGEYFNGLSYKLKDAGTLFKNKIHEKLEFELISDDVKPTNQVKKEEREKNIFKLLRDKKMNQSEITDKIRGDKMSLVVLLNKLVKENKLNVVNGARGAKIYSIPKSQNMQNGETDWDTKLGDK